MLHHVFLLPEFATFRDRLASANNLDEMRKMVTELHSIITEKHGRLKLRLHLALIWHNLISRFFVVRIVLIDKMESTANSKLFTLKIFYFC